MKKIKILLFLIPSLIIITGTYFVVIPYLEYRAEQSIPIKIVNATAWFGGDFQGSLITVQYETNKNMTKNYKADETYIIIDETGKKLGVLWVPKIGLLLSQSEGKKTGWFIIDNGSHEINEKTKITIVIGDYKKNNDTVKWPQIT